MQWHIYVGGTEQPGLTEADNRLSAVEAWLVKNGPQADELVFAVGHVPFSPRRQRRFSAPARDTQTLTELVSPDAGQEPEDDDDIHSDSEDGENSETTE